MIEEGLKDFTKAAMQTFKKFVKELMKERIASWIIMAGGLVAMYGDHNVKLIVVLLFTWFSFAKGIEVLEDDNQGANGVVMTERLNKNGKMQRNVWKVRMILHY